MAQARVRLSLATRQGSSIGALSLTTRLVDRRTANPLDAFRGRNRGSEREHLRAELFVGPDVPSRLELMTFPSEPQCVRVPMSVARGPAEAGRWIRTRI